jgi:hypothetical protein
MLSCLSEEYIFWDITPCIPLKVNGRFGGTYCSIFRVEEAKEYTVWGSGYIDPRILDIGTKWR